MSTPPTLSSRITGTKSLKWKDFQFIQAGDFKDLSPGDKDKLKASILQNQFAQPFYVWHDSAAGVHYCLDGKHRIDVLHELEASGVSVPEKLDAVLIQCADKQDAAKLVLVYSSQYAKITEAGLYNFIEIYDLSLAEMGDMISLPTIDMKLFTGDIFTDFSTKNGELDIDEFTDEVVLKFKFPKPEYLDIKRRIADKLEELAIDTPEALLKHLLA